MQDLYIKEHVKSGDEFHKKAIEVCPEEFKFKTSGEPKDEYKDVLRQMVADIDKLNAWNNQ